MERGPNVWFWSLPVVLDMSVETLFFNGEGGHSDRAVSVRPPNAFGGASPLVFDIYCWNR